MILNHTRTCQECQTSSTPHVSRLKQTRRGHRAGWSLIELLVVVSLITVLLGIIINTAGESRGPEAATQFLVGNVHAIATEYEVRTDQVILADGASHNDAGSITYFVSQANKTEYTRKMLNNLGEDFITRDTNGNITGINDAWGRSLWYVAYNNGHTTNLPRRGKSGGDPAVFVASSGKDGKWGTYDATNKPDGDAADNIYSFSLP